MNLVERELFVGLTDVGSATACMATTISGGSGATKSRTPETGAAPA